jgi:hypothetical protein
MIDAPAAAEIGVPLICVGRAAIISTARGICVVVISLRALRPARSVCSHMKTLLLTAAVVALAAANLPLRADEHPITIRKNPAKISRQTFDPKHQPKEMPKLTPPESGVCDFDFYSDSGLGTFTDEIAPNTVEVEVDSVDMILDMKVRVWTAAGTPPKLLAHEEGHRQICEHYYQNAEAIARTVAQKMIGRKATASGANKKAAADAAMQKLLTELNTAYMNEVRVRCSACQKRYDKITNHSLIPIPEGDAIRQALAGEPPSGADLTALARENPPVHGDGMAP